MRRSIVVRAVMAAWLVLGCKDSKVPDVEGSPSATTSAGTAASATIATSAPTAAPLRSCAPRPATSGPGPTPAPTHAAGPPPINAVYPPDQCIVDHQCTLAAHGRCERVPGRELDFRGTTRFIGAHDECIYDACVNDVECTQSIGTAGICLCQPTSSNQCVGGTCHDEADCAAPFKCGDSFVCHGSTDLCQSSASCPRNFACIRPANATRYECHEIPAAPPG